MNQPRSPSLGRSRKQNDPVSGILTFIIADLIVFGMLFTGFMVERAGQLDLFNRSARTLNLNLGVFNMLILITSGALVVMGVHAAREGLAQRTRGFFLAAFLVGSAFGLSKIVEYGEKFALGINMQTNDFYMFYFALTGAHFLHFLGGMGALAFVWFQAKRQAVDGEFYGKIEATGLYWHMVDLLWILIFPLLYLLA